MPVAWGFLRGGGRRDLAGRLHLREGFFDLGAEGFCFENTGANVGGDAELGGGGSIAKLRLFRRGQAKGDAGDLAFLLVAGLLRR